MTKKIDFYFDFSSPYGYFAAELIEPLASEYGCTVDWHPVLLGVIFKSSGSMPLTMMPMKGEYALHDIPRTARFYKIPLNFPEKFPLASQQAARVFLVLSETDKDAAKRFARAVFQALFVAQQDISEPQVVASIASELGHDGQSLLARAQQQEVKDKLKHEVDTALSRNVFGSPCMLVDDQFFWGVDRLDQLRYYLKFGAI